MRTVLGVDLSSAFTRFSCRLVRHILVQVNLHKLSFLAQNSIERRGSSRGEAASLLWLESPRRRFDVELEMPIKMSSWALVRRKDIGEGKGNVWTKQTYRRGC